MHRPTSRIASMAFRLPTVLTGPAAALLDSALRGLVDEAVDARALVRQQELDALTARLDTLRADLGGCSTQVEALRQAVDAHGSQADLARALGLSDPEDEVDAAEARRVDLAKRVGRLIGALDTLASHTDAAAERIHAVPPVAG